MRALVVTLLVAVLAVALNAPAGVRRRLSDGQRPPTSSAARSARPAVSGPLGPPPEAALSGLVTTDGSAPVPVARVCAAGTSDEITEGGAPREPSCASTDGAGRFRIDGLRPGRYRVAANAPSFRPAVQHLELRPGAHATGLVLALRGGGVELAGVVLDLTGGPIAEARVVAGGAFAQADHDGRFRVWTDPGTVEVTATAAGYAGAFEEVHAPGRVELFLIPASSIGGIVVDGATGAPVANVQVEVATHGSTSVDDYVRVRARSDAAGRFGVTGLRPGRYRIDARAPHAYGRAATSVRVGLAQTVEDLVVKVYPAAQVSGRVVVASTSKPCEEPSVSIQDSARSLGSWLRRDPDGVLVADGVLPGAYDVVIDCRGMQGRVLAVPLVIGTEDVHGLVWEVHAGATISGQIRDSAGRPVAGATISASHMHSRARAGSGHTTSAADGRYLLTGLEPGPYQVHVASTAGSDEVHALAVPSLAPVTLDVRLGPVGAIAGEVVDAAGHPVANVIVQAIGLEGGPMSSDENRTDAAGAFRIAGLPPGAYRVIVLRDFVTRLRAPGATDDRPQGEVVAVRADADAPTRLVVEAETGTLRGRVVGPSGAPVTDAFVTVVRESDAGDGSAWSGETRPVVTGLDGAFTVARLSPGTYRVRAYQPGGADVEVHHVAVGSANVVLELVPPGSIAGRLLLPAGALALAGVTVTGPELVRAEVLYRTDGAFRFDDLPAGHYVVEATFAERRATVELDLAASEARAGLELDLVR